MTCVVVAAGLVTPVGLSLGETAAATRARMPRLRECSWLDRRFEPFIVGRVPESGLPALAPSLANESIQAREARMLRLAHAALSDTLSAIPAQITPPPLLLGLPEHHTQIAIEPARFLQRLALQSGPCFDLSASVAAPRGRASALMALSQAVRIIESGQSPYVLVGGVDSLNDLYILGTLDREQRIRGETVSDGFTPSEGAGFILLAKDTAITGTGLKALVRLSGSASGQEPGNLYAQAPYLGEGLAAAVSEVLAQAATDTPIQTVFSSFNGERYWAREFGVARIRNAQAFGDETQMEHPAECFGDLGAAHGIALAAVAAHGVSEGYRRAPCLVYASSDHADRAAVVFEGTA
ncbi:beta-ketoacyl synthase N-terminal-like domain-containing protein [Niveibacterium sp. 24ML]|uniref:beta-ketoacyl synthase N-terminal-like domain-containing protein n=1 Tax=Niveibacterium sp. 24ML TaxID=2985512 RepID=UPI00226D641F|nr:beta-ketoacyl synthase N-terminal-like domain-containing protein [Niveibacterium sp. 24ML]MCX9156608.1 beta-ketoacyl synthase N-terminal-like domain-containing protein [Niveibacterium sp. 24ML]